MVRRSPKPMVAGNWKMNGLSGSLKEVRSVIKAIGKAPVDCEVLLCPPATLLLLAKELIEGTRLKIGGQDCHASSQGAHTGDISAEMLKNAGASAVLVGHSERRNDHKETNMDVRSKAAAAHRAGLIAVVCVGETLKHRESRQTLRIVGHQLKGSLPETATAKNTVIAYEPVWAIGTGMTPTLGDIGEIHAHVRKKLRRLLGVEQANAMRVLYGGSVKPDNAAELLSVENVDGALVGGASLQAKDFLKIVNMYR